MPYMYMWMLFECIFNWLLNHLFIPCWRNVDEFLDFSFMLLSEVRIYKREQESKKKKKKENTLSTKKTIKKRKFFLSSWSLSWSRVLFSFFFSWPLSSFVLSCTFLVESVLSFFFFSFFFLIAFLVESVFSCFFTFLFSFINSHLRALVVKQSNMSRLLRAKRNK